MIRLILLTHSLDYRPRGKREPRNRDLGIMIITSKDIRIVDARVFDNTLLSERTLCVKAVQAGKKIKIMSLHSITGCDHKRAKSLQFYAFPYAIDKYQPDIVSFDANEPEIDAPTISEMKFFDNKDGGDGAREFFTALGDNGLKDVYLNSFDGEHIKGQPLAVSQEVKRKGPARYDFIFANDEIINVERVEYKLQEAKDASGDHVFVVMDFEVK